MHYIFPCIQYSKLRKNVYREEMVVRHGDNSNAPSHARNAPTDSSLHVALVAVAQKTHAYHLTSSLMKT
jgi:hypothetical protein